MSHLTKPEQPDRSKINVANTLELKCWAHTLGVPKEKLRLLVERVGSSAALVRKEIGAVRRKNA
jgi:hypothetical protein